MTSGEAHLSQQAMEQTAVIALGSNTGDSPALLRAAMDRLQTLSDRPIQKSSLYRSAPVDCPPGSPDFLNAVVLMNVRQDETPLSLLRQLQAIEKDFGRQRGPVRNAPRPLDLDLIAFGEIILDTPELTLPHPRAHQRAFVLMPLAEIAPDYVLPGLAGTV